MAEITCPNCGNKAELPLPKRGSSLFCAFCRNTWQYPLGPRPEQTRGTTHGDYTKMATVAQRIKDAMRDGARWGGLACHQAESLELVATKIARIVEGDPACRDHWDDLRGYVQLVLDRLPQEPQSNQP